MTEESVYRSLCDLRHSELEKRISYYEKEVEEVRKEVKNLDHNMQKKFTKLFYSVFGVALLLILNLVLLLVRTSGIHQQ